MGQKFYKLDNTDHPYLRADIALIKKKPGGGEPAKDEVSAAVNAARNIKLDDDKRVVEPPKVKEASIPEWDAYKKLNKKDREKALARAKGATEKATAVARREQVGGSSGSGIARDPATGRALKNLISKV